MTFPATLSALLLAAAPLFGASVTTGFLSQPDIVNDSLSVDPAAPEWGVEIIPLPDEIYFIGFNDNWGNDYPWETFRGPCQQELSHGCDLDGNDAVLSAIFNSDATSYILQYVLSISRDANFVGVAPVGFDFLHVGQSGTYASIPGTEVVLQMYDSTTGRSYFTGPANRNADGVLQHAFVTAVPEPASVTMIVLGLSLIALGRKRRTRS